MLASRRGLTRLSARQPVAYRPVTRAFASSAAREYFSSSLHHFLKHQQDGISRR